MRVWPMQACRWWGFSRCRTPSRPSPRSSGKFRLKAKRIGAKAKMRLYGCSITGRSQERSTNRSASGCLPLDAQWQQGLTKIHWPTANLPEVMGSGTATLRALIREYLFISLFRACAESLASENASRLAAMERADKNINDLLEQLHGSFHQLRQSGIDEELFDVISGFEALSGSR